MKKLDWQKKRSTILHAIRRDSDGYEVMREEESGFVFRRKRQKLPPQSKSGSKKKSSKKIPSDLLPLGDLLVNVLTPVMQHEVEAFISGIEDSSKAEKLREVLSAFTERVLTPSSVLTLAKVKNSALTKGIILLNECKVHVGRQAVLIPGGDVHATLREVCSPEIAAFVETMEESTDDLESKLRKLAPKPSSAHTQIDQLQHQVTCLRTECAQWNTLKDDLWPTDISLNAAASAVQEMSMPLSESDIEQIGKDKHQLLLQCMEVQQSITAAEELCIEAERLFRDLQAKHNHQEMAAVLVSDDPRVIIKNLLTL